MLLTAEAAAAGPHTTTLINALTKSASLRQSRYAHRAVGYTDFTQIHRISAIIYKKILPIAGNCIELAKVNSISIIPTCHFPPCFGGRILALNSTKIRNDGQLTYKGPGPPRRHQHAQLRPALAALPWPPRPLLD